jgi:hypothetical protein
LSEIFELFGIAKGGETMRELTREEMLEILCAPEPIDEPEESDFVESDETAEEIFVQDWIRKETN